MANTPVSYQIKTVDGKYINGRVENEFILDMANRKDTTGELMGTIIEIVSDDIVMIKRRLSTLPGATKAPGFSNDRTRVIIIKTNLKKREVENESGNIHIQDRT